MTYTKDFTRKNFNTHVCLSKRFSTLFVPKQWRFSASKLLAWANKSHQHWSICEQAGFVSNIYHKVQYWPRQGLPYWLVPIFATRCSTEHKRRPSYWITHGRSHVWQLPRQGEVNWVFGSSGVFLLLWVHNNDDDDNGTMTHTLLKNMPALVATWNIFQNMGLQKISGSVQFTWLTLKMKRI